MRKREKRGIKDLFKKKWERVEIKGA